MFEASSHMPSTVVSRRDLSLGFASLPPIDVQKIWSVLWRGKITILLSMMVAVGLAAAVFLIFAGAILLWLPVVALLFVVGAIVRFLR